MAPDFDPEQGNKNLDSDGEISIPETEDVPVVRPDTFDTTGDFRVESLDDPDASTGDYIEMSQFVLPVYALEPGTAIMFEPERHEGMHHTVNLNHLHVAAYHSVGQGMRSQDEDGGLIFCGEGKDYLLAADGMGGHGGGILATSVTLHVVSAGMYASQPIEEAINAVGPMLERESDARKEYLKEGHTLEKNDIPADDMGLVVTALEVLPTADPDAFKGRHANLGDSRLAQFRSGQVQYVSKDHSLLNDWIDSENITAEQAYTDPTLRKFRPVVTRRLGLSKGKDDSAKFEVGDSQEPEGIVDKKVSPSADTVELHATTPLENETKTIQVVELELLRGDVVLLASDGFWDVFSDVEEDAAQEVAELIAGLTDPAEIVAVLEHEVRRRVIQEGGKDDNIVIIVGIIGKKAELSTAE